MKKVNELLGKIKPIREEIKKRCLAYLKKTLKNANSNRLDFCDEEGNAINDEVVCVSYDGGRHPEYASNVFSNVNGVYLNEKGKIMLDTEDDDAYSIESITWDELVNVADYVYRVLTEKEVV